MNSLLSPPLSGWCSRAFCLYALFISSGVAPLRRPSIRSASLSNMPAALKNASTHVRSRINRMLQFWWRVDGVERMRVDVPSGFAAAWSDACARQCAQLAAFGSYNSACSSRPMVGALLRRVSDCAPLNAIQRFLAQAAMCLLVSQAASPRKISTPSRFVLLLGALFGRLAHGYEACARGPGRGLHITSALCSARSGAKAAILHARRRVKVADVW